MSVKQQFKRGDRVFCIAGRDADGVTDFLGVGVYEGDFPIGEEGAGDVADMVRRQGATNPRIRLDSGAVVWGAECWWGPEAEWDAARRANAAKGNIGWYREVDISGMRERARRAALERTVSAIGALARELDAASIASDPGLISALERSTGDVLALRSAVGRLVVTE